MRIGIDISQMVHEGTGVAVYVRTLVQALISMDTNNEYVLFGASFRKKRIFYDFYKTLPHDRVQLVTVAIPPTVLEILWNRFHVIPVEKFIGPVDIFWSSDWTQPPLSGAKGVTTIHDLTPLKFPKEMDAGIVAAHTRRLSWVQKECNMILCDSQSTKKDVMELLHIAEEKLHVVYPGVAV